MKQPEHEVSHSNVWNHMVFIRSCDSLPERVVLSEARTESAAYRKAARRLRKLANDCERRAGK